MNEIYSYFWFALYMRWIKIVNTVIERDTTVRFFFLYCCLVVKLVERAFQTDLYCMINYVCLWQTSLL